MGKTSDEISYGKHNLWIIDERLSFHNYLTSDLPMQSNQALDSNSKKEPDLIVFDNPFPLSEGKKGPYKKISIVEFKRPLKDHHYGKYEPLTQVENYIKKILKGEIKKNGRPIDIGSKETVRFFCYIISELSNKVIEKARSMQLLELPENEGYVGYDRYNRAYYEVIPFNRLLSDAEKRNEAFFEKIGI